jgi:predicted ester cyclase
MTLNENKAVVLRFNKEFLEKANKEVLKDIVAEGFINHTAAGEFTKDTAGLIKFIDFLHAGFSDFNIEIHDMIAENDLVCSRKTIHVTHTGTIMGHVATGKKVMMSVIDMVRLKDGKYIEHWGRNDVMQVISQL